MASILIMEDDVELAFDMQEFLTEQDHDVSWTQSASEAMAMLETTAFDLLITDIYVRQHGMLVPDGGVILVHRIRTSKFKIGTYRLSKLPILAVTGAVRAMGHDGIIELITKVGADAAMPKPFETYQLASEINMLLNLDRNKPRKG